MTVNGNLTEQTSLEFEPGSPNLFSVITQRYTGLGFRLEINYFRYEYFQNQFLIRLFISLSFFFLFVLKPLSIARLINFGQLKEIFTDEP